MTQREEENEKVNHTMTMLLIFQKKMSSTMLSHKIKDENGGRAQRDSRKDK